MRIKEHLVNQARLVYIQKKSMGLLFYIPVAVNWILLPILTFLLYFRWGGGSFAAAEVLKLFQFFVPFFNSWWLILAFSEYIEGRGNELYYIAGRMKSGLAVLWTARYFCLTGLPFVFYRIWLPTLGIEILRIFIECIFFAGITYFLLFITSSSASTLAVMLIYPTVSSFSTAPALQHLRYVCIEPWTLRLFLEKYCFFLVVGCVFFAGGMIANRKYRKYQ